MDFRFHLAWVCLLVPLTACIDAGLLEGRGSPASGVSVVGDGLRLLTPEEAVDLARFRAWHYSPGGVISGVPNAREALVSQQSWGEARALLERVDPSGLARSEYVSPARKDAPPVPERFTEVFFVVVRGPVVSDRGTAAADSLAMVVDRQGSVLYLAIGRPWDTVAPPRAEPMPITAGNKLQDVSLARAQNEIGGVPLVEPRQLPEGIALMRININLAAAPIDETGATFDYRSVTFVCGDRTGRARLWLTQTVFLSQPRVPGPTSVAAYPRPSPTPAQRGGEISIGRASGRRFPMQRDGIRLIGLAWTSGDRSFYLAGELGADLTEVALVRMAASILVEGARPPVPVATSH